MKELLIIVTQDDTDLWELREFYNVVVFNSITTLQFYRHRYSNVMVVVFLDKYSSLIYDINLPGFLVIVVSSAEEVVSKRWSRHTDVFDIVSEHDFFVDPILRLQVYRSLDNIIKRYSLKKYISTFNLCMELYRAVHKSDESTGYHNLNSIRFLKILYQELQRLLPAYRTDTRLGIAEEINAALLHDVGKLFVPKEVLHKPTRLTNIEFEVVKSHPSEGRFILHRLCKSLPQVEGLEIYIPCTEYHHERWDGKGYPYGLVGDEIPLSARLVSIVDVYDALISKRSYKDSLPHSEAVEIIMAGAGTQFDPNLVQVFQKSASILSSIRHDE